MSESIFPWSVIDVIKEHLDDNFMTGAGSEVVTRPLRLSDANESCGLYPLEKTVENDSYEMGNGEAPTLQRYDFRIHLLTKHSNEQEARKLYAERSKKLWVMLYHDRSLALALSRLRDDSPSLIERYMRKKLVRQRYVNNEVSGSMVFVSATDFWVETQNDQVGGF